MANGELEIVRLKNDFYRDGFYKVLITLTMILVAISLLVVVSIYLSTSKPKPITFSTLNEWRLLSDVPLNQPYLSTPDLLQWISSVIPMVFTYDFIHYKDQLNDNAVYFTDAGWKQFLGQLNQYVSANAVQNFKIFTNIKPESAPFIKNKGMMSGRFAWLIVMPVALYLNGLNGQNIIHLVIQAVVVRIPTFNNLNGIAVDNVTVTKGEIDQVVRANG